MKAYLPREPGWTKAARSAVGFEWPNWARFRMHPYKEQFLPASDLPVYAGQIRPYLIATTPRCGSHFLGHAISSSAYFGFPLEYMNRMNLEMWRYRFKTEDPATLFDQIFRVRSGKTGWFGVKAHWNQYATFDQHAIFGGLGGFRRAIWLYRRDLAAQAISRVVAEQTGQWISGAPQRGAKAFDYDAIVRNARLIRNQNEKWSRFFDEDFVAPTKKIVFEDIMADQEKAFYEVVDFLDSEAPVTLKAATKTTKQSNQTSKEWRQRFEREARPEHRWILESQVF